MLYIILIVFIIFIDLATKNYIEKNYKINEPKTIVKDKLFILHLKNKGAAYGLLQNNRKLLYVSSFVSFFFVLIGFFNSLKKSTIVIKLAYTFIVSGAIGNIYERVKKKQVTDFIYIKFNKNAPVFNFADIFVFLGCILILFSTNSGGNKK